MKQLTHTTPAGRGLTEAGRDAFCRAYEAAGIFQAARPVVRFPQAGADIIRTVSELRRKSWRSTDRWNMAADATGLIGELAAMRYLGISAEAAMADFIAGLAGDRGHDLRHAGELLDVKSTRGQAHRFKFSKQNPHRDRASAYIFVSIQECGAEVWATLLGWARKHEIKPYVRDDGRSLFVRAETLRREGILKPVSILKTALRGNQEGGL